MRNEESLIQWNCLKILIHIFKIDNTFEIIGKNDMDKTKSIY